MCNLYFNGMGPATIMELARAVRSEVGNLEPGNIFPDYSAPIVRMEGDERIVTTARWGMPSPAFALEGKRTDKGITNVRNTSSPHWRRWIGPANRCLVPVSAFSEPGRDASGKYEPVWFALDETCPPMFFAGIWTPQWTSVRKVKDGPETIDLMAFLTTEPSQPVKSVHPKAMPVILIDPDEIETWMRAEWSEAKVLQRPLPDGAVTKLTD